MASTALTAPQVAEPRGRAGRRSTGRRSGTAPLHPASPRRGASAIAADLALALVGVAFVVPLAWIVLAAFDPSASVSVGLPSRPGLGNFTTVVEGGQTLRPLWNSTVISMGTAVITVVVSVLAAYPLSRYQMRFRKPFLYGVLFATTLPITAIMVPVYALFVALGLLGSTAGTVLFLAATSLPIAIWMTKNFMDSVPVTLEEAAWTDGASAMVALRRIVVPLMRPGLAVVFIFVFAQTWGNFFVPFVLLSDAATQPAAVAIYTFFGTNGTISYGQLAAFSILYSVPVLVLYLVVQRVAGSSAMAGGIKG